MAPGTAASRPAARPAGTRYLETVFRSWFSENAAATRKPHAPVRNAKGNGMSIGWIGCDVLEAVLFMHTMRASREPATAGSPKPAAAQDALTPTRSRISLSVEAAPSSGRLLM